MTLHTARLIMTMAPSIGGLFIIPPPQLSFFFQSFYLLIKYFFSYWQQPMSGDDRLLRRETTGWNKDGIETQVCDFLLAFTTMSWLYWNTGPYLLQAPNTCAGPVPSTMACTPARSRSIAVTAQSWAIREGLVRSGIAAQHIRLVLVA